ncbi:hypothetical protein [Brevundimonas sp.]|jgi:hypothetical protein|uniref:hypothetical protein n=1 Tax=Brevundimonas sp. TaxID=1871086 RepID=UPI0037BFECD4
MAKLTVNVSDGSIEIEGDEAFILTALGEVRGALKDLQPSNGFKSKSPDSEIGPLNSSEVVSEKIPPLKSKQSQIKNSSSSKKSQPSLNTNLDLSKLPEFIKKYKPKNNTEKILVFCSFLRDILKVSPCADSDIYSCFHSMKSEMKIPEAFAKNMNDAKKEGYIEYTKLSEVIIPTMGENHLVYMAKKVSDA